MTRKLSVVAATAVAALAATLLLVTSPASAHSGYEAIRYGCGWSSYNLYSIRRIKSSGGTTFGYAYLARRGNTWCAVTRKTRYHGTSSYTSAGLYANGRWYRDRGQFGHWAAVKKYAPNGCHRHYGYMKSPYTDWSASSGTSGCYYY